MINNLATNHDSPPAKNRVLTSEGRHSSQYDIEELEPSNSGLEAKEAISNNGASCEKRAQQNDAHTKQCHPHSDNCSQITHEMVKSEAFVHLCAKTTYVRMTFLLAHLVSYHDTGRDHV